MTLLLLALLVAQPQDPPAREKASAFTFVRAKGWSRQELANNLVGLAPPGPDAQQCSLFIFAGFVGEMNELVYHDKMLQSVTQGCQVEGKAEKAYRGTWQYTRVKVLNAQRQPQWMALYTAKSDAHREAFYFVAATEELSKTYRFTVEKMITSVVWPDARPQPPSGAGEFVPARIPDKDKDVKILGAWTVARMERNLSVDPKAGELQQQHTVKVFALFENHVAAKVDALRTGLIDSTYPAEGLATMDVSDPAKLANRRQFGSWSEEGGQISIKWNEGPADTVVRQGDDLKEKASGILWSSIKPVDGLLLDGTYIREVPLGPPGMLLLRKDGSFDADQVNEVMGGKISNPKFPELGSGTYEFRKWSLILRFDTGFVQSIQVMIDGDNPAAAKTLLISSTAFVRSGPAASAAAPAPAPAVTAAGPGGTTAHGLVLPLPADWLRKNDPGGLVVLAPPQNQNPLGYYLCVSPSNKLPGTHWESHKMILKAAIPWAEIQAEGATIVHTPDGPGPFIWSTATGKIPSGAYREINLFTAVHDGTMEAITVVNKPDTTVLWPILQRATFKDPPKPVERPKVVEAYRKLVKKLYTTPGGGPLAAGSIMYERMWLRSDGTADFTSWYNEGYAASPYVFKLDPGLLTGHAGSWKSVGDKIQVQRSADAPPEIYERVNGGIGAPWETMPRVDGLKLSGRYSKKSLPMAGVVQFHHWIDFTEEGRFKTDGVLTWVGNLDPDWPKFPDRTAGTYEIRDWTIFFKFDDGRSWSTDVSTIHQDPKDLSGILFRTNVFLKE